MIERRRLSQAGGRLSSHLSRKISPFPGKANHSRGKKPFCLGQRRSAVHTLTHPHPIPVPAGRAALRGRRDLRALPSSGGREVPALDLGPGSPARPFRPPHLAQSSRFERKIRNCIYIKTRICVRDTGTRSRASGRDERRGSEPSPLPSAAAQTCGGLLSPIGALPAASHQAASSRLPLPSPRRPARPCDLSRQRATLLFAPGRDGYTQIKRLPLTPPQPHAYLDTRAPWALRGCGRRGAALAPR